MRVPSYITKAALRRARMSKAARAEALQLLMAGKPLEVEPDQARKIRRIAARVGVTEATAASIASGADLATLGLNPKQMLAAKAVINDTIDFLPISVLARARKAANAVGHVVRLDEVSVGTCFMISPKLLITNHHVIEDEKVAMRRLVQFNFEDASPLPVSTYELKPGDFFVSDDSAELDFSVIALGDPVEDSPPFDHGFCRLSGANDKHSLGEFVNIIQHPLGNPKQIVVRENRLINRPTLDDGSEPVLQYTADTEDSSSGSPVFNDDFHVVALHHAAVDAGTITVGGVTRPDVVNEGARASFIVEALKARRDSPTGEQKPLTDEQKALLDEALAEP